MESIFLHKEEVKEILNSNIDDWITDKRRGLHCSACQTTDNKKLLNNPSLPRILCIRCFRNILLNKAFSKPTQAPKKSQDNILLKGKGYIVSKSYKKKGVRQ